MDDTMTPDAADADGDKDLCVDLATLAIDGTQPEVGDTVDLKVKGSVTKIVNGCAWVEPSTINGQPVPESTPAASDDDLMKAAQQHDSMSIGGGAGGLY